MEIWSTLSKVSNCRDSLLYSSSESFNLGLQLEVIEEQNEVGKSKEEDAKDESHK